MSKSLYYQKFLFNKETVTKEICDYLENVLARDDEAVKHSFHEIMVPNWTEDAEQLFNNISDYFNVSFVPVNYMAKNKVCYFYTCSLSLVMKIIKKDFIFSYKKNMFIIDILFNVKSSIDCFENKVTIEDIVTSVVCNRFNEKMELDLSNFCNDPEFTNSKLTFYKLSLLANFKILMLRMGRDTKILNLSNNQLIQVPLEVLNFFIKGEIIGLNLSNNNIPSIQEQFRVSSKIEKLWLEGNPLCDELEPDEYIKKILIKFPRLIELDGVKINQYGTLYPFQKHFMVTQDDKTRTVVEKFVTLYFTHYDTKPRTKINMFYDVNATLSISTDFSEMEQLVMPHYAKYSPQNLQNPMKKKSPSKHRLVVYRKNITNVLSQFPESIHDKNSFNVDVVLNDNKHMILVLDGIFKEKSVVLDGIYNEDNNIDDIAPNLMMTENYMRFRRTFIFTINTVNNTSMYHISNELFSISLAEKELKENSFKYPIQNMNTLSLLDPDESETYIICKAFMHMTTLKESEAERRLKAHNWDIRVALKEFIADVNMGNVPCECLMDEADYSDISESELD